MTKYRFPLNLQLFAEEGAAAPGVESAPAAEGQENGNEGSSSTSAGAEGTPNNFEKAFAKRLAEKETQWKADRDAEIQKIRDEYKDHDAYKKAADYLQRSTGINDIMTLKEEIELQELQERADKEKVSPAMLKRLDELEAKAAKADELEAATKQQSEAKVFEDSLKTFSEGKELDGKPLDHQVLWKYMHENQVVNPEVAFKAMRADAAESALAKSKDEHIADYLKSKKGTKTEGSPGAPAQTIPPTTGGGFEGAEARAIARMKASRET